MMGQLKPGPGFQVYASTAYPVCCHTLHTVAEDALDSVVESDDGVDDGCIGCDNPLVS